MNPLQPVYSSQALHALNRPSSSLRQQKDAFQLIEHSRTVRPSKAVRFNKPLQNVDSHILGQRKNLNTTLDRIESSESQMTDQLSFSNSLCSTANNPSNCIPVGYRSDILWKTQISQSFIEKLQELESSSEVEIDKNAIKLTQTTNNIKDLSNQVIELRLFAKQMCQKVIQMHKVYSEGNKKSIELVMLIVKQLEKQNQALRQKVSSMNLLAMSQSIRTTKTQDYTPYPVETDKQMQKKTHSPYKQQAKISEKSNNSIQAIEANIPERQVNETQTSISPSSGSIECSPVWSVLLTGDYQLQTIQQLDHDDDTYSLHEQQHQSNIPNAIFSPRLGGSGRISAFSESHISYFQVQSIEKVVIQPHEDKQVLIQQPESIKQKPQQQPSQTNLTSTINMAQSGQNIQEQDEQQSLIVKKLLKLNKLSHRKNSSAHCIPVAPQIIHITQSSSILQSRAIDQKVKDPFSGISLSNKTSDNSNSISEALSILKEYSQNAQSNSQVLAQSKENNKKITKSKVPSKISIVVSKKVHNKENVPF